MICKFSVSIIIGGPMLVITPQIPKTAHEHAIPGPLKDPQTNVHILTTLVLRTHQ